MWYVIYPKYCSNETLNLFALGSMAKQGMLHSRGELLLMLDADGATKVSDLEKLESQVGMTFDYSDLLYLQNVVFIIMIPSFGAQIFIQASNENLDFIDQYTSFISSNYSNSFSENPTSQCSQAISFQSFVSIILSHLSTLSLSPVHDV